MRNRLGCSKASDHDQGESVPHRVGWLTRLSEAMSSKLRWDRTNFVAELIGIEDLLWSPTANQFSACRSVSTRPTGDSRWLVLDCRN